MAAILTLRRGTTTPNTLEPSELFFNSGSNTLNVGGQDNTPITLVKIGSNTGNITLTGNLSINGDISGSTLKITGDTQLLGNLTLGGSFIKLGNDGTDEIEFVGLLSGSLIPDTGSTYDIGSVFDPYRHIYVDSATISNLSAGGSGILSSSLGDYSNFDDYTSSVDSRLDNLQVFTSSQETINGLYNSFTSSTSDRLNNLETFSSSQEDLNGTFATTGSNTFTGNQTITGSILISSSNEYDISVFGKVLIEGGTTSGSYPELIISSSDSHLHLRRNSIYFNTDGNEYNTNLAQDGLSVFVSTGSQAFLNLAIVDQPNLTTDVELMVEVDSVRGITFEDFNVSGSYETFLQIEPNLNNKPKVTFTRDVIISGSLNVAEGEFGIITGSGQLTSSLTFTHNVTAPNDGNAILELRHNNDLYNDDVAIKLKADFAGAYIDYEEDGAPYPVLSVQSFANKNIYLHRDTRLLFSSLRIDNNLTVTGSLLSSASAYFLGDVTASIFTGSFIGDGSGLTNVTAGNVEFNNILNKPTLVSGSSQINVNDTQNFQTFSSSVDSRLDDVEFYTSSLKQAIDVSGQDLTIYGNLTVQGETTTLNTTELLIEDKVLAIASGSTTSAQAEGAGLYISGADASMLWDDTNSNLVFNQKVSSSVGFKGDGSELTGVTAAGVDFDDITNKPTLISGSDQVTSSLDYRYLNTNGEDVVSGSAQIIITDTTGFSTFSGSLKTTDDGQDSRLSNLELTSQSHDSRITQLESDSGSQGNRIDNLESFTSSQETINSTYNSYTQSNDTNITKLFGTSSQYQSFSESIDTIIKNKIDLEGVVSSSSDTSTISLSIQDGVISGSVIGGVVSGSDQVTSSLDALYEVSGSVAQLTGIHQISGSLGSAAWYNVSSSISNGDPAVLGNAGAVKDYIDEQLLIIGAGDITAVTASNGLSGGADSGPVTLSLDTASLHFTDGVDTAIIPFSSSVSASIAALESSSGYINYVTNSIEQLTGIEVADFDSNVAVTFIGGTLKFIFGTPAVPSSIAASLSGFLIDRFNKVEDAYDVNASWNNGGYTLISASLYEGSILLQQVGTGTTLTYNTTTSGSHTYTLEYTGSSPLDGSIYTNSTTTTGTISKSNPASPTLTPSVTVQLGASSNQIEQGATGSISFTSSSADPSNGWDLVEVTTNVSTPYLITGSATGSASIVLVASSSYESPIGDNDPDLTIVTTTTQTYTKIRSLRRGASTNTSFTEEELANLALWDTTLGGEIGTIAKGTTNPSGQSVTISWSGDKYHYIVFDSSRPNLSNITTSGFGVLGQFSVTTVGQYKVYKTNTLQAGGAGSSITYTLT